MSSEGIPKFSKMEMDRRHLAAASMCLEAGVDVLLIAGHSGSRRHNQADVHYLTQTALCHDSFLLVQPTKEAILYVTAYNHFANAVEIATHAEVRRISRTPYVEISKELKMRGLDKAKIGVVGPIAYQTVDGLRAALPDATWKDVTAAYRNLRTRKSAEELEFQKKAAQGCDAVMAAIRDAIRPGVEEHELLLICESVAWGSGCTPNFLYLNSTSMKDSTSCVPNQHLSRRKLCSGDVINTELTVSFGMYSAQLLRPFFLGEPTTEYAKLYEVLKRVHDRLAAAMRTGTTLTSLYEITLEFRDNGYTTVDGILHGFAVDLLPPRLAQGLIAPAPDVRLERDTTIVLQPNPTSLDERIGMQLGELGLITDQGFVSMHASPAEVSYC